MIGKFISFVFLVLALFVCTVAETSDKNVRHVSAGGGVEFTIYGKVKRSRKMVIDQTLYLDSTTRMVKRQRGKLIYDFSFSLDESGFRTSPASFLTNKSKHVLVIDASIAFGEGLNDDQTITHLINSRSKTYEAYELGFMGSPPQNNWLIFKKQFLKGKIKHKKGLAIIIAHEQEARRLEGTLDHLTYVSHAPLLVENGNGNFEYKGSFASSGSFVQRAAVKYCIPLLFCNNLMMKAADVPTDDQIKKLARLYASMEKMYREQFDVENILIMWIGNTNRIQSFTEIKTFSIPFELLDGGHPSEKGAKQIVDYLFEHKIIY